MSSIRLPHETPGLSAPSTALTLLASPAFAQEAQDAQGASEAHRGEVRLLIVDDSLARSASIIDHNYGRNDFYRFD